MGELLDVFQQVRDILVQDGLHDMEALVTNDVHERDTGYASFYASYDCFDAMKRNLISDYKKEAAALVGTWFDELNFGEMILKMEGKSGSPVDVFSLAVI